MTASVRHEPEMRDNHLKSGDFLLIEEHPAITFRSTAVRPTGDDTFELDGDLTIRGRHEARHARREFARRGAGTDRETPMLGSRRPPR